jgi:hypothetical protein
MINSSEKDFELEDSCDILLKILNREENQIKFELHVEKKMENFLFFRIKFLTQKNEELTVDIWHDCFIDGKKNEMISFSKKINIGEFKSAKCEIYNSKLMKPNLMSIHQIKVVQF